MTDPQQPSQRPDGAAGLPPSAPFGDEQEVAGTPTPAEPDQAPPLEEGPVHATTPPDPGPEGTADSDPTQVVPAVGGGDDAWDATEQIPPVPVPPAPIPAASFPPDADVIDTSVRADHGRPRRRGLVIAVVALVILLVAGILGWRYVQAQRFEEVLAADGAAARQVVQSYFTALDEGDAEAALASAAADPEESSLLTDEVLTAAQEAGGIEGLVLGEATLAHDAGQRMVGDAGTVAATYTVGDIPVETEVPVNRVDGSWQLATATSRVALGGGETPRRVNGQQAGAETVELFPGSYTVEPSSPHVELEDPRLVVTAPDPAGGEAQSWTGGTAALTEEGREAVLSAARASLTSCLAQRSLAPEGCPIEVQSGADVTVEAATIRYTLVGSPWEDVELALQSDARAGATLVMSYRLTASARSGGVAGVVNQTYEDQPATFTADLSQETPTITWQ